VAVRRFTDVNNSYKQQIMITIKDILKLDLMKTLKIQVIDLEDQSENEIQSELESYHHYGLENIFLLL
jgi:5,10-methylenetetrahydrofolate reductase